MTKPKLKNFLIEILNEHFIESFHSRVHILTHTYLKGSKIVSYNDLQLTDI